MRKALLFLTALALVTAGCGGGGSSCADIADDSVALFQDAIDELDGLDLADLENDPFETEDFERRSEDLDKRTVEAGCTDEELSELFIERVGDLSAESSNPAGQFLISLLTTAAENGEFDFGG